MARASDRLLNLHQPFTTPCTSTLLVLIRIRLSPHSSSIRICNPQAQSVPTIGCLLLRSKSEITQ